MKAPSSTNNRVSEWQQRNRLHLVLLRFRDWCAARGETYPRGLAKAVIAYMRAPSQPAEVDEPLPPRPKLERVKWTPERRAKVQATHAAKNNKHQAAPDALSQLLKEVLNGPAD